MTRGKILAVDDENGITEYLQVIFQQVGFDVKTAGGGWEAWDLLNSEQFDVVITDVRMDQGDGIELIEKISDMNPINRPRPKVAIMSAYSDISISDIYERGAFSIIQKPPQAGHIIKAVVDVFLPQVQRWQEKDLTEAVQTIALQFPSFSEAVKSGKIAIGQGGVFIHLQEHFPIVDDRVKFRLSFAAENPPRIEGTGFVRWVRPSCLRVFHTGIGLEIDGLEPLSLSFLLDHINENAPKSYIPVGQTLQVEILKSFR